MEQNEPANVFHVCMGSACHKLGIYHVLPKIQDLIAKKGLEDRITLKGAFCLGNCSDGIIVKLNDRFFTHVNADNIELIFERDILPALE